MNITVLREAGYEEALLGLSLSYNRPVQEMPAVAERLRTKGDAESKLMRHMIVWLDVEGPRYWWMQFAEYRIGNHWSDDWEWQSESTMHTIMRKPLAFSDFEKIIPKPTLVRLNELREAGRFRQLKAELPESFLQRRIVTTNYQAIRRILQQRKGHRLSEWAEFIRRLVPQLQHPEYVKGGKWTT